MLEAAEPTPSIQKQPVITASPLADSGLTPATEQATLGSSVVVKGDITGSQALYVDGRIEGKICFPGQRITIGRRGTAVANIEAKEVVIMGTVTGNIDCSERVDIRADAVLTGDVLTQRISIDEGAMVKGSVEIRSRRHEHQQERREMLKSAGESRDVSKKPVAEPHNVLKAAAEHALQHMAPDPEANLTPNPQSPGNASSTVRSASRISGSSVLFEEHAAGKR
jgi:cytoskeletal protein CcmA (bactofilin family)